MPIEIGAEAPDFTLKTQDEQDWKLSDQRGKTVVLLWYPLDWSPTCEKENCKLSTEPTLEGQDLLVVGISRDSTWSHKAWKQIKGIGHDLLADPTLSVTDEFGLRHPAGFISHRATVIVDKSGQVSFVQVQENTPEERDWSEVQAALTALNATA